jgi:hypothetical protein
MYTPPQVERYYVMTMRRYAMVKAFPYTIASPPDGSYVVMSFLHYVYVIDDAGQALAIHASPGLSAADPVSIATARNHRQQDELLRRDASEEAFCADGWQLTTEMDPGFPCPKYPLIGPIAISGDGSLALIAVQNALAWLTRDGRIAQIRRLGGDALVEWGQAGSVSRLFVSQTGRVVVADVGGPRGLFVLQGTCTSSLPGASSGGICAVDEQHGLIAWAAGKHLRIFNTRAQEVASVDLPAVVRGLRYAAGGRVLFAMGNPTLVLLMRFADTPPSEVRLHSHADRPCLDVMPAQPDWTVERQDCGVFYHHVLSADGSRLFLPLDESCGLDVYVDGKLRECIRDRATARSMWKQARKKDKCHPMPSPQVRLLERRLQYIPHGASGKGWSYTAGARIRHVSTSPSGAFISVAAGVRLSILDHTGRLVRTLRLETACAYADDAGGCIALSSGPQLQLRRIDASTGAPRDLGWFPERLSQSANRGRWIAFVTTDGREETVWFADLSGRLLGKWNTRGRNTLLEWAAQAPVVLVSGIGVMAAFDMLELEGEGR